MLGKDSADIPKHLVWLHELGLYYNIAICPYRLTPVNFTIQPSWHSDMLHFLQSHIQAVGDALAESISADSWVMLTARRKVEEWS